MRPCWAASCCFLRTSSCLIAARHSRRRRRSREVSVLLSLHPWRQLWLLIMISLLLQRSAAILHTNEVIKSCSSRLSHSEGVCWCICILLTSSESTINLLQVDVISQALVSHSRRFVCTCCLAEACGGELLRCLARWLIDSIMASPRLHWMLHHHGTCCWWFI